MKKIILFILITIGLMIAIVSAEKKTPIPTIDNKLTNYTDVNFKKVINYGTLTITRYETAGNFTIIYMNIDNKTVRWITHKDNFQQITR